VKRAFLILLLMAAPAAAEPTDVPPVPRLEAPTQPVHLQPIVIPRQESPPVDKRPYLVAGGLLVLAAIFIWNRDRARKLDEEHGPTRPRDRRWRVQPDRDDDANDLADAAQGEADDHEEKP
jgi:hypothetical protein